MILFTRVGARDFRVLFTRCVAGRPRGPAPLVVIQIKDETRAVIASTPDGVTLTHTSHAPKERDDFLLLPATVLAEVEGGTDEIVTLERRSKLLAVVRWHGGGKPGTLPVGLTLPGKQHEIPESPELSPASEKLLPALHECGRSAACENGRFALSRVQLQGRAGRVVGTDGKIALLATGFKFPFTDDILVPALPVFGSKPLVRSQDVRVGRTSTHLVVAAGPWSVWLPFDTEARYPDVVSLIPEQPPTVAQLDHNDVVELLKVLSGLPGKGEEDCPVTIDVGSTVKIRGRDVKTNDTQDVTLAQSTVSGPAQRFAFNRCILARALSLGCRTLKVTPGKPLVVEGEHLSVFALALDSGLIVPPTGEVQKSSAIVAVSPTPTLAQPIPTLQRSNDMPPPDTNGHTPPRGDPADPLFTAEELRDALADATSKAARLVAALKAGRREKKVLASVFANLKQLGLDSGGPP